MPPRQPVIRSGGGANEPAVGGLNGGTSGAKYPLIPYEVSGSHFGLNP